MVSSSSSSDHHSVSSLVGTAITLGIVHVLTGPDHLSAIATLSANVEHSAFWLGIRWGIGHSTGLILVGVIFIILSLNGGSDDDKIHIPERVSRIFESLVGLFMLLLGIYGVRRAWAKRPKTYWGGGSVDAALFQDPLSDPTAAITAEEEMQTMVTYQQDENSKSQNSNNDNNNSTLPDGDGSSNTNNNRTEAFSDEYPTEPGCDPNHQDCESPARFCSCLDQCLRGVPTRVMALGAGIVHGLAGPGGVLGVIPAVQMHDARLASIYLFFFCLTSTLTMGLFASLYGTCSSRLAGPRNAGDDQVQLDPHSTVETSSARAFWIEALSASLSIVVGILWLGLLSVGKLEDVFP